MEDTLREAAKFEELDKKFDVLILVLMEDTLRDGETFLEVTAYEVLILVLMEDTLRDQIHTIMTVDQRS